MQRQDQCHGHAMMSQFAQAPTPASFITIKTIVNTSVIPIWLSFCYFLVIITAHPALLNAYLWPSRVVMLKLLSQLQ